MNKFRFIILSTCCLLALTTQAQKIKIKTGIEVLKEQNFKCLEGKRVGLITNPTGVDNHMVYGAMSMPEIKSIIQPIPLPDCLSILFMGKHANPLRKC